MQVSTTSKGRVRKIPGQRPKPLLWWRGILLPLMRDPIHYMEHLHCTYEEVMSVTEGSSRYVFVFSPEYNHQVLNDKAHHDNDEIDSPSSPVKILRGSTASSRRA